MAYPHKCWSPISYKSSTGQRKHIGQRPMLCHWTTPPTMLPVVVTERNHHNRFTVLFRDHPGEPVPEENFWTLWCKGRLTEADTQTIQLGATPSRLTSAHLHHPAISLQAGCPSCRHTNGVKALKAMETFGNYCCICCIYISRGK